MSSREYVQDIIQLHAPAQNTEQPNIMSGVSSVLLLLTQHVLSLFLLQK
jgi:hypothetical protein